MILVDHLARRIKVEGLPKKVVSLVPSQTELLVDLGLQDTLVGVTKFCIHPRALRASKTIVGGTKKVNYDKIKSFSPDLILCNKEENTQEMVQALEKIAPVHVSDIKTFTNALQLIDDYGTIFNVTEKAQDLQAKILKARLRFRESVQQHNTLKVAYLIWREPLMAVGGDTFINAMLEEVGFQNIFSQSTDRYPEITEVDLKDADIILLSSEPYPFNEKHVLYFEKETGKKVTLVDGAYFSWYGSRLRKAFPYFSQFLQDLEL